MTCRRLFITGTDTGVGKTQAACWTAREMTAQGLRVGLYKPVCSGASGDLDGPRWDDVEHLSAALGHAFPEDRICPQRFLAPLAPPVAAMLERRSVDESALVEGAAWWDDLVDVLVIEGVGGWLSPISETMTVADLAVRLGAPVLIVAANRLGVINHSLLTIESVQARRLPIAGLLLNQAETPIDTEQCPLEATNLQELESRSGVPVLGMLSHGSRPSLIRAGEPIGVDWNRLLSTT
jgi:dethiobiotin synthetase